MYHGSDGKLKEGARRTVSLTCLPSCHFCPEPPHTLMEFSGLCYGALLDRYRSMVFFAVHARLCGSSPFSCCRPVLPVGFPWERWTARCSQCRE